ncbi:MAG TPA: hypothetical protein VFQ85_11155 [Mycobacteriales bacterium]|jgi:hypothetical protein|nr:hypothetical protein [Mycobacteriales bacterium]
MDRSALEALTTEELREKAFGVAERRLDVGFFWDLVKHLPASARMAGDDAFSGAPAALSDVLELFREFRGDHLGDAEPLVRAKLVDYLAEHGKEQS